MGASELVHEVRNAAMEVKSIVKARLGKINEVVSSDRHLLGEKLHREASLGGFANGLNGHD